MVDIQYVVHLFEGGIENARMLRADAEFRNISIIHTILSRHCSGYGTKTRLIRLFGSFIFQNFDNFGILYVELCSESK